MGAAEVTQENSTQRHPRAFGGETQVRGQAAPLGFPLSNSEEKVKATQERQHSTRLYGWKPFPCTRARRHPAKRLGSRFGTKQYQQVVQTTGRGLRRSGSKLRAGVLLAETPPVSGRYWGRSPPSPLGTVPGQGWGGE